MPVSLFPVQPPEKLGLKEVRYEKADWVARITIDRPQNYNAYSTRALQELTAAFQDASWDDRIAAVVFTGSGQHAFCTGGDVKEYQQHYTTTPRDYWKYMCCFKAYLESITNCAKPVIARLNGMAVGGGNESQLACDLAVMGEHSWLGQVGTGVGSVACGGATQWLPLHVGDRRARAMLFLNRRYPAFTALGMGLVNVVIPTVRRSDGRFCTSFTGGRTYLADWNTDPWEDPFASRATPEEIAAALKNRDGYSLDFSLLDSIVDDLCRQIVEKFFECTRYTKAQVNFWKDLAWHSTVGHARDWLSIHYTSLEPHEGMSAFVEKRKADYAGLRRRAAEGGSSEFLWGPYAGTCPACGAKGLPTEFAFCGKCGAAVGAAAESARAVVTSL
ncbi:MAG: enoyl-CoA hydratase/isomerase family protein [Phycisphaerae bacterium]|nr:enoyl-CoA hydratase/isomerase family protein [Phycisphaerae bacterium]NUQ45846.1 enoyl-CoA hydratase/isomerase family protein [Phycisphaerae bacterium]